MARTELDHLLYAGPDLAELRRDLLRKGGPKAAPGGRHDAWGTHNALVGLGVGRYLELIAPEPGGDGPWARLFRRLAAPSLQAWCVRGGAADQVEARLTAAGVATKRVAGGRRLPDGSELTWQLVFPRGHRFGGALPFFIDWQGSEHPSSRAEPAAELTSLTVEHPEADALSAVLEAVGTLPELLIVRNGSRTTLEARFVTGEGEFALEGVLDTQAYLGEA